MGEPKVCFLTSRYNLAIDLLLDGGLKSSALERMDGADKYWCADECAHSLVDLKSMPGALCNDQVECCVLANKRAYRSINKSSRAIPDGAKMIINGGIDFNALRRVPYNRADRIILMSVSELYNCLEEDSMICVSEIVSRTEAKVAEQERIEEQQRRARELESKMSAFKKEVSAAWKTANDILAWVTEEDCGPGGITPKYIQQIIARYIYLKDAEPATIEEAKRYAEASKAMLAEIASDESGVEAIKKHGYGLEDCRTIDSETINCNSGYKIRNEDECTLVSGIKYTETTYSDHGCYYKPKKEKERFWPSGKPYDLRDFNLGRRKR